MLEQWLSELLICLIRPVLNMDNLKAIVRFEHTKVFDICWEELFSYVWMLPLQNPADGLTLLMSFDLIKFESRWKRIPKSSSWKDMKRNCQKIGLARMLVPSGSASGFRIRWTNPLSVSEINPGWIPSHYMRGIALPECRCWANTLIAFRILSVSFFPDCGMNWHAVNLVN